ncbi:MAG: 4Fe-4S binding protein [Promethearchaeota archaeon]
MKIPVAGLVKRVSGTGDFISLDADKCTQCGRCIISCVMQLWKKTGDRIGLIKDYQSKCLECGACYQVCDADAIRFRYPQGGTGIIYERG